MSVSHSIEIILTEKQSVLSHISLKINTPVKGLKVSTLENARYQRLFKLKDFHMVAVSSYYISLKQLASALYPSAMEISGVPS